MSLLPSALALGLAALASVELVRRRVSPPEMATHRTSAANVLVLSLALQGLHFAEEWATGFPERFGPLFGVPPMSTTFFVAFNLSWLGAWAASVPGVRSGRRASFFAAWFLAIAGTMNGVAHPALALVSGGYFPGLVSAPVVGVACLLLGNRLLRATQPIAAS